MGTFGWVLLGIVAVAVIWLVGAYNNLVSLRQRGRQALADIEVQLKQRHDLVPNLVETVKGYARHETSTLENVIKWRNAAAAASAASGTAAQAQAETQLTAGIRQLIALAEAYPDLKANTNFQQLQTELADLENKLAASRRFFNNTVAEYNATREAFPNVVIAGPFGFGPLEFFNLDPTERTAAEAPPKVQF